MGNDAIQLSETPTKLEGPLDLSDELWRSYEWIFNKFGQVRYYSITSPQKLWYRRDGSTHRILDAEGVVHCVPAPGERGCVLRWQSKDINNPVAF